MICYLLLYQKELEIVSCNIALTNKEAKAFPFKKEKEKKSRSYN